ncbi:GNAT family N-acetyltransferase [Streptococcus iniae]
MNWKAEFIEAQVNGEPCYYYGILNGKIITEATAAFSPKGIQNADGLISNHRAYVMAFRTVAEEEGKGYFSQLFQFILSDLKKRGYQEVTLGVEPEKNETMPYIKNGVSTNTLKQQLSIMEMT